MNNRLKDWKLIYLANYGPDSMFQYKQKSEVSKIRKAWQPIHWCLYPLQKEAHDW